ncbi:MAG TPA: hypothetical protein VMS40_18510 [Vicinamibacterales bacterium]|nr:hypothetical protein [Vicinamibacterales bacterium]
MTEMYEDEEKVEPTDTAPTNESHAQEAQHSPLPWRVFDEDFANHHFPGIEAPEYSVVIWGHEHEQTGVRGRTAEEARDNAAFIVRACNNHEALLAALKECAFRLATLIAASGDFTDIHAKALDAATAAITNAEGE